MGLLSILNIFSPIPARGASVTVDELKAMMDRNEDITIVDVRNTSKFGCEHIAGSVNIPLKLIRKHEHVLLGVLDSAKKFVLCDDDGTSCWEAREIILKRGAKDVLCLKGGMKEWVASGSMMISD